MLLQKTELNRHLAQWPITKQRDKMESTRCYYRKDGSPFCTQYVAYTEPLCQQGTYLKLGGKLE